MPNTLSTRLAYTGITLWPWELIWTVNGTIVISWHYREEAHARYEAKVMEHLFKSAGYEVVPLPANPTDPEHFPHI